MEKIDINKIVKGEISLQAFDAETGELKRESKGLNTITRRGMLEMILSFIQTKRANITTVGSWSQGANTQLTSASFYATKLPTNCGARDFQARGQVLFLNDSTPAESYATSYGFTNLIYSHGIDEKRNAGSDIWDKDLITLNLSWSYGAADWAGTVNSLIIGDRIITPVDASHRVVLAAPFIKLISENAVLNWKWTLNLPAV